MVRLNQPRERSGQVWLDISRKMKSQGLTWLWLDQCHIIKASSFGQVWLDQMPPHGSYQEWWLLIFHGSYKPKMWPATFIHEKEFHFSCVTPSSSSLVLFSPSPPWLLISKVASTSLEVFSPSLACVDTHREVSTLTLSRSGEPRTSGIAEGFASRVYSFPFVDLL